MKNEIISLKHYLLALSKGTLIPYNYDRGLCFFILKLQDEGLITNEEYSAANMFMAHQSSRLPYYSYSLAYPIHHKGFDTGYEAYENGILWGIKSEVYDDNDLEYIHNRQDYCKRMLDYLYNNINHYPKIKKLSLKQYLYMLYGGHVIPSSIDKGVCWFVHELVKSKEITEKSREKFWKVLNEYSSRIFPVRHPTLDGHFAYDKAKEYNKMWKYNLIEDSEWKTYVENRRRFCLEIAVGL